MWVHEEWTMHEDWRRIDYQWKHKCGNNQEVENEPSDHWSEPLLPSSWTDATVHYLSLNRNDSRLGTRVINIKMFLSKLKQSINLYEQCLTNKMKKIPFTLSDKNLED